MRRALSLLLASLLLLTPLAYPQQGGMGPGPGVKSYGGGGGGTLSAKVGSLTEPGATGNQAITGVGFQPSVVLFWWNRLSSDGNGPDAGIGFGVGISSSARRAIDFRSTDNTSPSVNSAANRSAQCIYLAGAAASADFVSQDSDGFTVNWTVVTGGNIVVNYLALGGSALTNSAVGTITAKTSTGSQAYTGVGFQPTSLLLYAGKWSSEPLDSATNGAFTFGAATSATARGLTAQRSKNGSNPQVAKHRQSTGKIAALLTDTGAATEADFTSFDADGFTLNYTAAAGSADSIYYLALRGPSVKVGAFNQATSTGNQATTGVGFQPKALILFSANDTGANNDTTVADGTLSMGAATSSTARFAIWAGDLNNVSPTQSDKNLDRTKIIKLFTPGTPTLNAAADLVSLDADGWTLNWTTADATARQIIYFAIG
jgi:hypothetical protein